jgi:hypothetical protein
LAHLNVVWASLVAAKVATVITNPGSIRLSWGSRLLVMSVIIPGWRLSAGRRVRSVLWRIFSLNPIVLFGAARINGRDGLPALPQFLFALFTQVLFEQRCVAGVCTEHCVGQITKEWNQSNGEIENDVDQHPDSDRGREAPFYLATCPVHHQSHKGIECIASTVIKSVTSPL